DVEAADHVGVDISARVFDAVAHARLRREVDDDVWRERGDEARHRAVILKHEFMGSEGIGDLAQLGLAAPYQSDVVIWRHAVDARDLVPVPQQAGGDVKTDEAR